MQWRMGSFEVDSDPLRIDMERVYQYLKTTYWASDRSYDEIAASWKHSHLAFGVYAQHYGALQIACARVVTDTRTFGWLADVFVDPLYRGQGVGKFLLKCIVEHPDCSNLRLFFLGTRDAHGLYEQFQWESPRHPERFMVRYPGP
ncbi:MAG TPA: GNAT family N-acetyltransferase [Candidatus Hydrogenedentes bacterium]|nr:GNAT family N-acetyltransferase [Candidatus Hydrogenedentota bacterium]